MTDVADLVARTPRHDWRADEVRELFELPFSDLLFAAQSVHRRHFDPHAVQVSTLLSVKTGGCPEDCAYCPQSARYDTGVEGEHMMSPEEVAEAARRAKDNGATRFCMGAAFRSPKPRQLDRMIEMIRAVRELELETCLTAGMLTAEQAQALAEAGLDYYNHNIDTSAEYYDQVVTTRSFQERLDTLEAVREAGIHVCCGGIVGMGEAPEDRGEMLRTLANLPEHPESVPINQLVQVPGTPFHGLDSVDPLDFVRVIAVARILMPSSHVRLAAGRTGMSDETQALCFHAGANSIFYGDKLLTTGNPEHDHDRRLFERLGVRAEAAEESAALKSAEPRPATAGE